MAWLTILDRGNHGLSDSAKYRQIMTDFVYEGLIPQGDDEERPAGSRTASPTPKDRMAEAKELHAKLKANAAKKAKPDEQPPAE